MNSKQEKQMEKGWESVEGLWRICPPLKGIVIDTETTGLDFEHDEILQVSIVDLDGNLLFNSYGLSGRLWEEDHCL